MRTDEIRVKYRIIDIVSDIDYKIIRQIEKKKYSSDIKKKTKKQ